MTCVYCPHCRNNHVRRWLDSYPPPVPGTHESDLRFERSVDAAEWNTDEREYQIAKAWSLANRETA